MPKTASSTSDKKLRRIFKIHQQLRSMNSFSADELVKVCLGVDSAVNERTVRADIQFLRDLGAVIPRGNKHQKFYYKEAFSIVNALEGVKSEEIEEMRTYLNQLYHKAPKAALLDLDKVFLALERRVRASDAQGDPRLQFERSEYSGQHWIWDIYDYVIKKKVLILQYRPFQQDAQFRTILPVFLKEYNHRWFLIAYDADILAYQNFALDRIEEIKLSDRKLTLENAPDPETYFNNMIGVSLEGEMKKVIVRVKKPRAYYIRTKRWHHTQKEEKQTEEFIYFSWTVYTNRELLSKIFELGPDAKVLWPKKVRDLIEGERPLS